MMRLLIDDRWLGPTGIGRFASEVIRRLQQRPDLEVIGVRSQWRLGDPLTPLRLQKEISRVKPDVFWSPSFMPPLAPKLPFIFTIHDLLHLRYHTRAHVAYYNLVIRPLAYRASKIITVSEFARTEIVNWLNIDPSRVVVAHNAVSRGFTATGPRLQLDRPYILYIGNRRKHKNIKRLIKAFGISNLAKDFALALNGPWDRSLFEFAKDIGVEDHIRFLGVIPEPDLPAVYRGATIFVYVSLYEGFGIPPLEAMACGVPVVTSNTTALPEVVDNAALLVDPESEESIAIAMQRLATDEALSAELRRRGVERARFFSWDRTADIIWREISFAGRTP